MKQQTKNCFHFSDISCFPIASVRIKPREIVGSAFSGISTNGPGWVVNWNGGFVELLTQLFSGKFLGFCCCSS